MPFFEGAHDFAFDGATCCNTIKIVMIYNLGGGSAVAENGGTVNNCTDEHQKDRIRSEY